MRRKAAAEATQASTPVAPEQNVELLERALLETEKKYGKDHTLTAQRMVGLADAYRSQQKYDKAIALLKAALVIYEKNLGSENTEVSWTYQRLGIAYAGLGNYAEAESNFLRGLAIMEKAVPADHAYLRLAVDTLVQFYKDTKQDQKAAQLRLRLNGVK